MAATKKKTAKKTEETETALATAESQALSTEVFDYGDDEGEGFEGQTMDDLTIPMVYILQPLSPQVTAEDSEFKAGMLYNNVTEEAVPGKNGILFVPCSRERTVVEWIPREKGGGVAGTHDPSSPVVVRAKERAAKTERPFKWLADDGTNELVETVYLHGIIVDDDLVPVGLACIPFKGSMHKPFRNWMTAVNMFTLPTKDGGKRRPPLWAHLLRITTTKQHAKGHDFYNLVIQPANGAIKSSLLSPDHPAYQEAKNVRQMIADGKAKVDHNAGKAAGESESEGEAPF